MTAHACSHCHDTGSLSRDIHDDILDCFYCEVATERAAFNKWCKTSLTTRQIAEGDAWLIHQRAAALSAPALTDEQRAVIEEAAQVLESAAAHNRAEGRTVLEHAQQDRADRLRAILAAAQAPADAGQAQALADAPWRVAEFWSSANPDKKVRMLAEGAAEIEAWSKRGDFIRWMPAQCAAPDERAIADAILWMIGNGFMDWQGGTGDDEADAWPSDAAQHAEIVRLVQQARATAPAVQAQPGIGTQVSMDVSTGDDDAGWRIFGTVVEVQDGVLLAVEDSRNFTAPPAPAAQPEAKAAPVNALNDEQQRQVEKCLKDGAIMGSVSDATVEAVRWLLAAAGNSQGQAAQPEQQPVALDLIVRDIAELDYSSDTLLDDEMLIIKEEDLRRIIARHAAPVPAAAPEPDMLWDDADTEGTFASSADSFAEDYAANCMSRGDVSEVTIQCAQRLPNRMMRIEVTSDEENWLKWEWLAAAPVGGTKP